MSNKKKITLKEKRGGTEQKFDFVHALNLLRLQEKTGNAGWSISTKENWIFKDNEICKKPNNRGSKKTEK